jgi:hypothetical protein
LATQVGLSPPVSFRNLISTLDDLPLATVTFESGPLTANFVHASGQLGLQSNGLTSFRGHVHDSGDVGGDFYLLAAALVDVTDASGRTPIFVQTGQVDILGRTDNWQHDAAADTIATQWSVARGSRVEWRLHVSTDPLAVTVEVVLPLFVVGMIVGAIFFATSDGSTKCHWDDTRGMQVCEKNGSSP